MDFIELTLPTPPENLALDEALLLEAEAGRAGEVLRLWELPDYAVVLGSAGQISREINEDACRADGVPILRRCSGGGTVLLGPGCLCFSLILSHARAPMQDVTHSYTYIMERVSQALTTASASVERAASSDLAVANQKISGNSQRRMRSCILHHGTLLYAFRSALVQRYLPMPSRQPGYRQSRAHEEFMANLRLPAEEIKRRLRVAWDANDQRCDWPSNVVSRLVREKYGRKEWTKRR